MAARTKSSRQCSSSDIRVAFTSRSSFVVALKGFSRTELIEHIYDQDFDRDSNTIEVFVTRIRKKLGPDVITTIRGLGYSLDDPAVSRG